ncbi:MAG: glycosyltransferase family 4 protein [Candidatus Bipolaricaulota bacterium]|nr:glycosyltransferase family 4 protein [Candidatus Bipolaricaulota bacterium]MDW8126475.1 glycosyltransferase family 4 protein [Candidatus Bipolaricaulota bacterium]
MALVVYCGAHLGHDPQQVPIGGGASVGHALIRRWAQTRPFALLVLGTGPFAPDPRVAYCQLDVATDGLLTNFSVRRYAKLAREFEKTVTEFLARLTKEENPEEVVVLHNDIAEAGDFGAIAHMGYRQAAIFHVDVVDYTANIYLKGLCSAPTLAHLWRGLEHWRLAQCMPDVLKLIFRKQEACARYCERLIVPSSGMARIVRASYPWRTGKDVLVIPWGALVEPRSLEVEEVLLELKRKFDPRGRPVLLTLSRISPEKGQDLLLRALRLWEKRGGREILLFICGAAAYMHGESYLRKLQKLAARLKKVEVIFPGHVGGARKFAFFELADLYVFPSRHESYGLTMMEAMAAGLPVLTTTHHSAQDLISSEFGLIVEPTPLALCDGLQRMLSQQEQLKRMGEKAKRFALAHPFWRSADALAHELLRILASTPPIRSHPAR